MGKSNSKLSAESFETRFKNHQTSCIDVTTATTTATTNTGNDEFSSLTQINDSPNLRKFRNLCKNFSKDFPNAQLSTILDDEHLLTPFLTDIFYQEVQISDSMQTLFRGNCLASKVMSHCFRTFGSKYLKQLLEPHISPLVYNIIKNRDGNDKEAAFDSPSSISCLKATDETATANLEIHTPSYNNNNINNNNITMTKLTNNYDCNDEPSIGDSYHENNHISYEIDSKRLEEDDNIDANQKNLLKLTKQILDSILSSGADFPPQLNSMCICLRQVLCKKYQNSDANLRAVGTVIFLRFINPAIVSPYESGIINVQPPARTMRGLMLVSKILQNIANNVEFSKEEHMLPFNDFVRTQFEPMRKWVSEISTECRQPI